jgi:hypothetical protein
MRDTLRAPLADQAQNSASTRSPTHKEDFTVSSHGRFHTAASQTLTSDILPQLTNPPHVLSHVVPLDDRGSQGDFSLGGRTHALSVPDAAPMLELYQKSNQGYGELDRFGSREIPAQFVKMGYPHQRHDYAVTGIPVVGTVPLQELQYGTLCGTKERQADLALQEVRQCRQFMEAEAAQLRHVIQQQVQCPNRDGSTWWL